MAGAWRPTWQMTDAELIAEAEAINRAQDTAALTTPATLLHHLLPYYRHRPHLTLIADKVAALRATPDARLLITTPPQVGKTVTAVIGGSLWWLAHQPHHRIIIGSHGNELAVKRGRAVRKMIIEHGHRYGLALEPGSAAVHDWDTTAGGGLKSVGVGAGIVGTPADLAIIDDPHRSRAEADSRLKRDRVYDWFVEDIISRLAPGAPVLLVMTRWHPDDLAGRLLDGEGTTTDGGRWTVVHLPALSLGPDADPLRRPAGAPLTHPRIRTGDTAALAHHWQLKRVGTGARGWHAQYQGDPRPSEGALLSRALLRERRCYTHANPQPCDTTRQRVAVAVDPSGGGRDTAGIVGGYLAADGRLYYTDDRSGVMASDQWARVACELAADTDADLIVVETNYGGDMATLAVRTAWDALRAEELSAAGGNPRDPQYRDTARYTRLCPRIKAVRARKNKLLRAEPIAQQFIEDRCRLAAYLPELEEEWATWQPDQTDSPGRIDASVYLGYALLRLPGAGGDGGAPPTGTLPTSSGSPLGPSGGPSGLGPLG